MIIVFSTYPDKENAEKAAEGLVEKDLAACVNILKIENSVYKWKGKIEKKPEYLLIMKTTRGAYPKLEAFIKKDHPDDVPEIIFFYVRGGNKEYIQWVNSVTFSKLLRVPLDLSATKRARRSLRTDIKAIKPRTSSR